mgnify:CR=1 FL=1
MINRRQRRQIVDELVYAYKQAVTSFLGKSQTMKTTHTHLIKHSFNCVPCLLSTIMYFIIIFSLFYKDLFKKNNRRQAVYALSTHNYD